MRALILLMATILSVQVFAQERGGMPVKKEPQKYFKRKNRKECAVFYINTSTGINNNTGLLGINFDKPVAKYVSVEAGLGISSWGTKFYGGAKYYFKPCHRGWAIGAGATYNAGLRDYQGNLETINGTTETVQLDLHPQANILVAGYHFWNLGRRANRIYVELGWSIPVSAGAKFVQTYGTPISQNSVNTMNILAPGGPVVGFGFSFGKF